MKQFLLFRLPTVFLMILFTWPSLLAQKAETPALTITVNGEVVERKVASMTLVNYYNDGIRYSSSTPRVALTYETDSASSEEPIDYIHPYVCRVFFGDAITNVNDLRIYEIVETDGNDLQLRGLKEGDLVMVYNTSGRKCISTRAGADGVVTDISSLPKGVYIIKAGQTVFKYYNRK